MACSVYVNGGTNEESEAVGVKQEGMLNQRQFQDMKRV